MTSSSSGSFLAAAGTSLTLTAQQLTNPSSISSDGTVQLNISDDQGSFRAAAGTGLYYSNITGTILDLGHYLQVDGTDLIAPALGGPVTLSTDVLNINGTLQGTDNYDIADTLTLGFAATLGTSGTVDAYGNAQLLGANRLDGTTLNLHANSSWNIVAPNQFLLRGATLNNLTGASLSLTGGGSYLDVNDGSNASINNFGSISASFSDDTNFSVPFNNQGSFSLNAGSVALGRDGMPSSSSGSFLAAAGTSLTLTAQQLTNPSSISSDGTVQLNISDDQGSFRAAGGTGLYYSNITGNVLDLGHYLQVDGTDTIAPAAGGPVTLSTDVLTINGTLQGTDNYVVSGPLTMNVGSGLTTSGTVDVGGLFTWGIFGLLQDVTVNAHGGLSMEEDGNRQFHDATVNNFGNADFSAPNFSYVGMFGGSFHNEATGILNFGGAEPYFSISGPGADGSQTSFVNDGTMIQDATVGTVFEMPVVNTGTINVLQGTLAMSAANFGTVTVASGAFLNSGSYTQTTGATILQGGELDGGPFTIDGGVLVGTGTIVGNVVNSGELIPGGAGTAGLLTIQGNYTQGATGAFDVSLGGLAAGTQYSRLVVSGSATLDGTLNVGLTNGLLLDVGNTFQVVSAGSLSGTFSTAHGLTLGTVSLLSPLYDSTDLTLVVVHTNRPPTLAAISDQTVNAGTNLTFTASASQPDHDSLSFSLDVGAPAGASINPSTGVFSWTPPSGPTTKAITVRVTDPGLGLSATRTFTVNVIAANLVVTLGPASPIVEGSTFLDSGSFSDSASNGPWTAIVNYGDGTGNQALAFTSSHAFSLNHVYKNTGSFTTTVTVTNAHGSTGSALLVETVSDAPISATGVPITIPQGIAFTGKVASLTDSNPYGRATDFAATIAWGD
ncbi:beta strand repeat-containing protein, partial [Singulisphaera rosea]